MMNEQMYLTVHALTKYIKRKFDRDPHLQDIYVKGEISNFKQHSSGHMYFTLKDDQSKILAVMFSTYNKKVLFKPENGMKVLLRGEISVYEPSGQYQIYVKEMQPDGIGELFLAYEQLKKKLEKEGIFHPDRKKEIPSFPSVIGVITSPTGAAIRDILTTIKRRYPLANVIIYPALVQGRQAAPSIVKAIEIANERKEADVLIVGRGGGSIEELWAFNEEIVARAIYASDIPIISAVGHETDTTIADFAADKRAATPTAAAELAVPHVEELMERVLNRKIRLMRVIKQKVYTEQKRYEKLVQSYAFRYPKKLYEEKVEQLDRTLERGKRAIGLLVLEKSERFHRWQERLYLRHPKDLLAQSKKEYDQMKKRLTRNMSEILKNKQKDFLHRISILENVSPLKIMEKGYSLVYKEKDQLVKSVKDVSKGDQVQLALSDGKLICEVLESKGENDG